LVWTHADPLIPLYAPVIQLQICPHTVGSGTGQIPGLFGQNRRSSQAAGHCPPQTQRQEDAAIVSGELIL
jgi:hypothetical protein